MFILRCLVLEDTLVENYTEGSFNVMIRSLGYDPQDVLWSDLKTCSVWVQVSLKAFGEPGGLRRFQYFSELYPDTCGHV